MASELILITGPTLSGKTWLANCMAAKYKPDAKIWDEPDFRDKKTCKEIRLFLRYHGRAIITMTTPWPHPVKGIEPNRVIMLHTKDA